MTHAPLELSAWEARPAGEIADSLPRHHGMMAFPPVAHVTPLSANEHLYNILHSSIVVMHKYEFFRYPVRVF